MKLLRFTFDGVTRLGALLDDGVVDLQRAYGRYLRDVEGDQRGPQVAAALLPADTVAFLERLPHSDAAARRALAYAADLPVDEPAWHGRVRYRLNDVRLERPIVPETVMAAGPRPATDDPRFHAHTEFYIKPTTSVVGPADYLQTQAAIPHMRPEAEIALIYAGGARHVPPEQAGASIYGYALFLDLIDSDRLVFGWEGETMFHTRYGEGASFDRSGALGPWIVTRDELPDIDQVQVRLLINNREVAAYRPGDLWRSLDGFSSHLSTFFPLGPRILGTGGVPYSAAVGADEFGDPQIFPDESLPALQAGDRVTVTAEGLGRLSLTVREEAV
jgi:acylpyruvate hydrolase